jgi:dihydroxyacid dehydratase/phosphogluconate dehydratase
MLHLRNLGALDLSVLTCTGFSLDEVLLDWEKSDRRKKFRDILFEKDGVDPDDVIMSPERAHAKGLTSTVCFPRGNIAPEGAVIKSTAIDPSVVGIDGIYRHEGPARVFTSEASAMRALKQKLIRPGDVILLIGIGPMGTGMEETAQLTIALKHLPYGKSVALLTDARFSGVSTGACIGHIGPEALAGGPIGRIMEGDRIRIVIDRNKLVGTIDFVGTIVDSVTPEEGARILATRPMHPELREDEDLPEDTRLWAALQAAGGGTWGGCVYDTEKIMELLEAGKRALDRDLLAEKK